MKGKKSDAKHLTKTDGRNLGRQKYFRVAVVVSWKTIDPLLANNMTNCP